MLDSWRTHHPLFQKSPQIELLGNESSPYEFYSLVGSKLSSVLNASVAVRSLKLDSFVSSCQPNTFNAIFLLILAIAEVYNIEGNERYKQEDLSNAIYFYTEGINVNCKDDELKARLYNNRADAYFCSGYYV